MTSFEDRASKLLDGDDEEQQERQTYHANARPDNSTYYMRLGVGKNSTQYEIRRAFLNLSQHYHTDMYTTHSEAVQDAMNTRFKELQEAYSVLSDSKKRAAYDVAGIKGPDRLALVPESWTSRNDVIRYIQSLDREVELINTAKMLSASSNITVNYSIAHFFPSFPLSISGQSPPLSLDAAPTLKGSNTEGEPTGLHAQVPSIDESNAAEGQATSSEPPPPPPPSIPDDGGESAEEKGTPEGSEAMHAEMIAMEVEIDGKRQIVIIPSKAFQDRLRAQMQPRTPNTRAHPPPSTRPVHRAAWKGASAMHALMLLTFPQSIVFNHSFEHAVSPKLNLVFNTEAKARGKLAGLAVGVTTVYRKSPITTYIAHVKSRMNGLKISFHKERVLSPLWTLRTKLTFLDGVSFFQKLQFSLTRKLSSIAELNNTLTWSLREHGYLRSVLLRSCEGASQYLAMHIGLHTLNFVGSMSSEVTFGEDIHALGDPPAKGHVHYIVSTFLLSGETQMGFEVWYYHRWLKHYGLSFTTRIPYAPSPFAASSFFVASSPRMMANQLSLLYKRGKHRISIPIVIMVSPTISHSIMWFSVPLCIYRLIQLVYRPYFNAKTIQRLAQLRREHIAEIDLAREKALMEQQALELKVMHIRAQESGCNGLVIINAKYGVLTPAYTSPTSPARVGPSYAARCRSTLAQIPERISRCAFLRAFLFPFCRSSPTDPSSVGFARNEGGVASTGPDKAGVVQLESPWSADADDIPRLLDVTIALQSLVRDSALMLPEGSKSQLIGFCDPDPYAFERKQLKIVYWFHGKKHLAVFSEEDPIELPQREHLCP